MNSPAIVSWTFDVETMSRGRYWHWFKTPLLAWLFPLVGLAMASFGIFTIVSESSDLPSTWLIFIAGVSLMFRYWILGIRFRWEIRSNPHFGKELRWTFSEDGFIAEMAGSDLRSDWSGFHRTYVAPDGFLLYPQKRIYYWIPKSGFSTANEASAAELILIRQTNAKKIG